MNWSLWRQRPEARYY